MAVKTPLWLPQAPEDTNCAKFITYVNRKRGLKLRTYEDVYQWSVNPSTIATFWADAYVFLDIPRFPGVKIDNAFQQTERATLFPPPKFFPSESVNVAEVILRNGRDKDVAIHFVREGKSAIEQINWFTLRERTRAIYDAMVNSGVGVGDRVAAAISNSVDAIVICLATLALGAVWSSASCDLGSKAIIDRFSQTRPKIIFADNGYIYGGKSISLLSRIAEWSNILARDNPHLQDVVILPYLDTASSDTKEIQKGVSWYSFLARGSGLPLTFNFLPFAQPAFIVFSSGTTGTPKCIVHSAGGVVLKVKVDSQIQHDMRPGDVIFQYTTTAWIMWVLNFVNLSNGISMLLYDGSPFTPRPDTLIDLAERVGVTIFGTSPRYLSELRSRNIIPQKRRLLQKLRIVTSTGSALSQEMQEWFYKEGFPAHVHLISMSGGTDLAGSLVGGTPLLPVYAGEIQAKCLGMAIDIFSASLDQPFSIEKTGDAGELVCTQPFPSQPLSFYGKDGYEKYRSTYFSRFGSGVWYQGDFVQLQLDTKGLIMLGRSDGVLNPSGVRFGSAEIYSVIETIPSIEDSICVGQRRKIDHDEAVLLFVKMKGSKNLEEPLMDQIKQQIRERYSSRHVPKHIFQVCDIPYTATGKKCEINVKQIVSGMKAAVGGTVANPESLALYQQYFDLPANGVAKKARQPKL